MELRWWDNSKSFLLYCVKCDANVEKVFRFRFLISG